MTRHNSRRNNTRPRDIDCKRFEIQSKTTYTDRVSTRIKCLCTDSVVKAGHSFLARSLAALPPLHCLFVHPLPLFLNPFFALFAASREFVSRANRGFEGGKWRDVWKVPSTGRIRCERGKGRKTLERKTLVGKEG